MDYEVMRLKMLELATQQGFKGDEAIRAAESMMRFAKEGTKDKPEVMPQARVVGRDGNLEAPFKDYLAKKD